MQTAHRCFAGAAVAVLLALVVLPAKTGAADDRVPMGGGAGIVINGDTMCTLTTIGGDSAGELIGFTSAHCGGPGLQVAAEAVSSDGTRHVVVKTTRVTADGSFTLYPLSTASGAPSQSRRSSTRRSSSARRSRS